MTGTVALLYSAGCFIATCLLAYRFDANERKRRAPSGRQRGQEFLIANYRASYLTEHDSLEHFERSVGMALGVQEDIRSWERQQETP